MNATHLTPDFFPSCFTQEAVKMEKRTNVQHGRPFSTTLIKEKKNEPKLALFEEEGLLKTDR